MKQKLPCIFDMPLVIYYRACASRGNVQNKVRTLEIRAQTLAKRLCARVAVFFPGGVFFFLLYFLITFS